MLSRKGVRRRKRGVHLTVSRWDNSLTDIAVPARSIASGFPLLSGLSLPDHVVVGSSHFVC